MSAVIRTVVRTDDGVAPLVTRLALGLVMFPHGAQKLLGWFGGYGLDGTLGYFASMGIPSAVGVLVILIEFFGALALIVGALGRVAALGIAAVMLGAVLMVHLPYGFFMNWAGAQPGEGFEFHILAVAMAAVVVVSGSGRLSFDRLLARRTAA